MSEEGQKTAPMRIRSIDYLRGFCILDMILTHVLSFWPTPNSIWLFVVEGVTFGAIAEVGFVLVSGIGFGFSWAKQSRSGVKRKDQNIKSLSHTLALLLVSIGFNLSFGPLAGTGGIMIWSWQILQTLAFCRLISLLFTQVPPIARSVIAIGLIALGALLLNWINFGNSSDPLSSFLFVLLYKPLGYYPIMIFFPFFLIGSVVGEELNKVTVREVKPAELAKKWFVFGLAFLITGITLGVRLDTQTPYNGRVILDLLHTNPAIQATVYPVLFDLNSYAWSFYFCGINIIMFLVLLYVLDLKPQKNINPISVKRNILNVYGRYSLTIYISHYLFFAIPFQFDASILWLPDLLLILIIYLIFLLLDKVGKGKISLEYMLGILGEMFYSKLHRIGKPKRAPTTMTEDRSQDEKRV